MRSISKIIFYMSTWLALSSCSHPVEPTWAAVSPEQRDCALRCSAQQDQCVDAAYRRYEQCLTNKPKVFAAECQETTSCIAEYNTCYHQCALKKPA